MNYPNKEKIKDIAKYLNEKYRVNYYIWNVSEHPYDTRYFNN